MNQINLQVEVIAFGCGRHQNQVFTHNYQILHLLGNLQNLKVSRQTELISLDSSKICMSSWVGKSKIPSNLLNSLLIALNSVLETQSSSQATTRNCLQARRLKFSSNSLHSPVRWEQQTCGELWLFLMQQVTIIHLTVRLF